MSSVKCDMTGCNKPAEYQMVVMGLYFENYGDFVCAECCNKRLKQQAENDDGDMRAWNRGYHIGCRKLKQSDVKAEKA